MRCQFVFFFFLSSIFAASTPILTPFSYFPDPANTSPIQAIAVDPAGNIYITGTTRGGIPVVNALQPQPGGGNCAGSNKSFAQCPNIFVAKFDPTGTKLLYSTYLSGDQSDFAAGIAVDSEGNAYIAGTTQTPGLLLRMPPPGGNAFVKKLNPSGSALVYTHYIGGNTAAGGIAVDANGNAVIVGYNLGTDFPSVHPLPVQPSVKSLYVTNDGGHTWRALNNGLSATSVNSLAIDPTNPSTLYAATSGGLYKSTDVGANWTHLLPAAAVGNRVVVDPRHPSTVYLTYSSSGVYLARSTDAGATWTTISGNFPNPIGLTNQGIGAFAIDPADSSVLWAIINPNLFSTVIKSTDSGDHWQVVYTFPPINPPIDLPTVTLAGRKLLLDPQNSSRLYACCGIYRSDDGGKSWTQGGATSGVLSALDPHNSSVLYGVGIGLQRSTDAGMTWAEVPLPPGVPNYGYETEAFAVDGAGTLYLLNDSGFLLNSHDGGASWATVYGPWVPGASILAIDPTNPATLYVASGASSSAVAPLAQHAFAANLDASGTVQWATLLGGSGQDQAQAVALDAAGNAYLTGKTNSDDFPVVNPFQAVRGRSTVPTNNAFVTKISSDGSKLLYSSFLGGTGRDSGNAIAVDAAGNAYVAGLSMGGVFPVVAPLEPQPVSPNSASFVAKVDSTGSKLVYSTLITGSRGTDVANTIAVDPQGRAIVAGLTGDGTFPLVNPIQPTFGVNFIARLTATGMLDFSTYLGNTTINSLALATGGALWIGGGISSLARIDFQTPVAQPGVPLIFAVYNGASFAPGNTVAPGEIVTLIGEELAPAPQTATGSGSLPRMMQGVSVMIGGVAAPLFYVSPGQINFQAPVEMALGSAQLVVQRGAQRSAVRTVSIVATAPGLFMATADLRSTPVIVHANDYSLVTEQNPAHPGEYLLAFCTGFGATTPAATSGEPAVAAASTTASVSARLDSGTFTPVSYAGLAPGWVGLYQINFRISDSETPGSKQIGFGIGLTASNPAPIWVQ